VALVIVISLIAMLTVVTVALLLLVGQSTQRTASEVAARQSEALAQTAFEIVLADLGDEMTKGSTTVSVNKLSDNSNYRQFNLSARQQGMRVTTSLLSGAPGAGILVKQSQPTTAFHSWPTVAPNPAPLQRSSSVLTTSGLTPVAAPLWNSPKLIGAAESFSSATAPRWVFVARNGSNPTSFATEMRREKSAGGAANPGFVLGRYAYNLYDTSGLLDINIAGFPLTGGPDAKRVAEKGTLALADLTRLPGMTQQTVDNLARWRHTWQSDSQEYLRGSEAAGWRKMAANDNLFLGRQDLLSFAALHPEMLATQAVPFMTHFSRDLDAPSYRPYPARAKVRRRAVVGGNDAFAKDDEVNPDPNAFNAIRKRPHLFQRFPLERLKYVATPAGATLDPAIAAKAELYFGLRWKGTYWEYVHARTSGDLYTLQDVPAAREPNFFEILRATVLAGSLARQYGAGGFASDDQIASMYALGGLDGSININILEMGACIIDQYDIDSYPTPIVLPGSARPYYIFGKEDVPYLQRMSTIPFRSKPLPGVTVYNYTILPDGTWTTPYTAAATEAYEVSMVLQPALWRPHQPTASYTGPTKFRIRPQHVDLGGGSLFYLVDSWPVPGKTNPPDTRNGDYSYWNGPNYRTTNPELFPKTFSGNEYLEVGLDFNSTAFREPQSVHSPAHSGIANYTIGGNVAPIQTIDADLRGGNNLPASYTQVSGFLVGKALHARLEPGRRGGRFGAGFFRGDPIEVLMEYLAPDGSWRAYQRSEFTYKSTYSSHYHDGNSWYTNAWYWTSFLVDPRTSRFGGLAGTARTWYGGDGDAWGLLFWPEGASLRYKKNRTDTRGSYTAAAGVWSWWTAPAAGTGWSYNGPVEWWMSFNQVGCVENDTIAWDDPFTLAYRDADDLLRPGVAANNEYASTYVGNPMVRRYAISATGALSTNDPVAGRPVVLNRPFRSVAELAYSFRGTPWRDIDFLDPTSPDSGLLDVFSLYEDPKAPATVTPASIRKPRVVAGRINLNTAPAPVIASLLSGVARDQGNNLSAAEADTLANQVVAAVRNGGIPLLSKAELVTRTNSTGTSSLVKNLSNSFASAENRSINDRREAITRGLADATTVRAWTFLLDLVVQSGRLAPTATTLNDFRASAERRYWIHFSVDRLTGELLDVQWENVN
jgi:hypothetical protein